jgi:hypothetical protein
MQRAKTLPIADGTPGVYMVTWTEEPQGFIHTLDSRNLIKGGRVIV